MDLSMPAGGIIPASPGRSCETRDARPRRNPAGEYIPGRRSDLSVRGGYRGQGLALIPGQKPLAGVNHGHLAGRQGPLPADEHRRSQYRHDRRLELGGTPWTMQSSEGARVRRASHSPALHVDRLSPAEPRGDPFYAAAAGKVSTPQGTTFRSQTAVARYIEGTTARGEARRRRFEGPVNDSLTALGRARRWAQL